MKKRLLSLLLTLCVMLILFPTVVTAAGGEVYVSSMGDDETGDGTRDNPYITLEKAVAEAEDGDTIYLLSDLTVEGTNATARITDKHIIITSDGGPYTITRGSSVTASDNYQSWYNGAIIEVTTSDTSSGSSDDAASVTLENIILTDEGKHDGTYFAQTNSTIDGAAPENGNLAFVQDAIVTAHGLSDRKVNIILGDGAVLRDFGGMSAVYATGNAQITMQSGSVIEDTMVTDRTRSDVIKNCPPEEVGPAGAVWLQGSQLVMEDGSEIRNIIGRAVYADGGSADINGSILNITVDADMWQGKAGVGVHVRNNADVTFGPTALFDNTDVSTKIDSAIYVNQGSFEMVNGSKISNLAGTAVMGYGSKTQPQGSINIKIDGEICGIINGGNAINLNESGGLYCEIGPNADIHHNSVWAATLYAQGPGIVIDLYGTIRDNISTQYSAGIWLANNFTGAELTMHDGAQITGNTSVNDGAAVIVSRGNFIMDGGIISDNHSVGSVSLAGGVSVRRSGSFTMNAGEITNNITTGFGGGIQYNDDSWGNECVVLNGGSISGNIMNADATDNGDGTYTFSGGVSNDISVSTSKFGNINTYISIGKDVYIGDSDIFFEKRQIIMNRVNDVRFGNTSDDNELVLNDTAKALGWNSNIFAAFWMQSDLDETIELSDVNFNADLPVYALVSATDADGAIVDESDYDIYVVDVNGGELSFTLPATGENGCAVALVQPTEDYGTLTVIGPDQIYEDSSVTEYDITYTITYAMSENIKTIIENAQNVRYALDFAPDGRLIGAPDFNGFDGTSITASYTLPSNEFADGEKLLSAAQLVITIDGKLYTIPSNTHIAEMIGGGTGTNSLIVTPADITIYTGGNGYEGSLDENGNISANYDKSGFPEPGYYITLPDYLNDLLGGDASAADLSDKLVFTYNDGTTIREWKLEPYGTDANSTDISGSTRARYIYRILPDTYTGIPVRLAITNGNSSVTNDEFTPSTEHAYVEYSMSIYSGGLNQGQVKATLMINGTPYTLPIKVDTGILTVRGLDKETTSPIADNNGNLSQNTITAVADGNVQYFVNGSNVEVADTTGVRLLEDKLLDENVLVNYIEKNVAMSLDGYNFEQKYLDIVDINNGNAYLTLGDGQKLTLYWPVPADAADGDAVIYHFDALDRSYDSIENELKQNPPELLDAVRVTINGVDYYRFETSSFSPFVLVYEQKDEDEGGGIIVLPYYTLIYDTMGAGTISEETELYPWTKSFDELPTPALDGYVFDGWFYDRELTRPVEGDVAVDTYKVYLYAGWSLDESDPDNNGVSDLLDTENHMAYLNGYPDNSFKPQNNMTRAEAAQMFYNLLVDKNVMITVSFDDVDDDAWYADAVNTLASLGILKGIGENLYAPNAPITRAEFTTIAMRFSKLDVEGENIFTDVDEDAWYYDYVIGSVQYGWINGYPDGTFRPDNTITRAEVTTIINRMLGRAADEDYVDANADELRQFTDLDKDFWGYYNIVEATNSHDYTVTDGVESWQ